MYKVQVVQFLRKTNSKNSKNSNNQCQSQTWEYIFLLKNFVTLFPQESRITRKEPAHKHSFWVKNFKICATFCCFMQSISKRKCADTCNCAHRCKVGALDHSEVGYVCRRGPHVGHLSIDPIQGKTRINPKCLKICLEIKDLTTLQRIF